MSEKSIACIIRGHFGEVPKLAEGAPLEREYKKIIIGDKNLDNAKKIADIMYNAGFDVNYLEIDLADRISIKNYIYRKLKNMVR